MPARSLRKQTRIPPPRSSSSTTTTTTTTTRPFYGRSLSSSAINIRSPTRSLLDEDINNNNINNINNKLPVIYDQHDDSEDFPSPRANNKTMGGSSTSSTCSTTTRPMSSPCSVLVCVNGLPTMSPRSARWCPSSSSSSRPASRTTLLVRHDSDSALTCPQRPGSLDLHS
jgi:hypothetical protein